MSEAFNPYREWLGLEESLETPHFYQLVGVEPFDDDRTRLIAAVDKALVKVRGFRPGAHAAAWAQLLDELAQAKTCFQDPARKSAYDDHLRRKLAASEPAQAPRDDTPQIALVNLSPDLYPPGMAPHTPSSAPAPDPVPADITVSLTHNPYPPGMAPVREGAPVPRTPAAKPRAVPPPFGTDAAPSVPSANPATRNADLATVPEPVPPGPVNAHVAPPRKPRPSLLPIAAAIAGFVVIVTLIMLFVALRDKAAGSIPAPARPIPSQTVDPPASPRTGPEAQTIPPRKAMPQATVPPGAHTRPSTVADPVVPASDAWPTAPETAPSLPAPDWSLAAPNASLPPVPAELNQTLAQAQAALVDRQFHVAHRVLEKAAGLATSPEQQARVGRLRHLGQCADQFWNVVATATRQLDAAQELTIGSAADRVVIVVETGPDYITIHNQGRNEKYTLANMPAGLALAIARCLMDEREIQTLVLFGACVATVKDRKPLHVDEARRYWEQAKSRGADVDDLLATLDDTYQP